MDAVARRLPRVVMVTALLATIVGLVIVERIGDSYRASVDIAVEGVATVADRLASFIEAVERFIPGDTESLAEDLRRIADGLEPAPDQLRTLGDQLAAAAGDVAATSEALDEIRSGLDEIDAGIEEAGEALDDLPALLAEVEAEAVRTRDRVASDMWLLRLLVVLGGLTIAGLAFSLDRLSVDVRRSARSGTPP
jgi:methyl-accepting chemotaxis protein